MKKEDYHRKFRLNEMKFILKYPTYPQTQDIRPFLEAILDLYEERIERKPVDDIVLEYTIRGRL